MAFFYAALAQLVYKTAVKLDQIIQGFIAFANFIFKLVAIAAPSSLNQDSLVVAIHTMAGGSNGKGVAAAALVVLVLMALVADASVEAAHAGGECNPNSLYPCLRALEGKRPQAPSKQCCAVVRSADKTCMCNQLKASSFPAQMVSNGLQLPKKCGRTDLRGFKCGRYTFPH